MINHFIHPTCFYTPGHFFEENAPAKTGCMDKMKINHSGLIHKLVEKLTDNCRPFLELTGKVTSVFRNKTKPVSTSPE